MKKGFTLIELLAVIVILAIIALIAVPIALSIINNAKEEARQRSMDNIIHAAEIYFAQQNTEDIDILSVSVNKLKDKIDGEKPESGNIYMNKKGEISFYLKYDNNAYMKTFTGKIEKESEMEISYLQATRPQNDSDKFLSNPYNITRKSIERIITVPTNEVPEELKDKSWDVSEKRNGSVMAWYNDEDNNGLYEVYIGQTGRVKANPNSSRLFARLPNVVEIDLKAFDTSDVTDMSEMFLFCQNLTSLDLSNFETGNVTNMAVMFASCDFLVELDVSSFNTRNVTDMTTMFNYCQNLTSLDLSNFDTSNVKSMKQMFNFCKKLTSLNISNFDTTQVETMYGMFYRCEKLASLNISSWKTGNVTDMSEMFVRTYKLTELDLSGWNTGKVTTMSNMFYYSGIKLLNLKNFDVSSVINFEDMFNACSYLNKVYVGSPWVINDSAVVTNMFGANATINNINQFEVITS